MTFFRRRVVVGASPFLFSPAFLSFSRFLLTLRRPERKVPRALSLYTASVRLRRRSLRRRPRRPASPDADAGVRSDVWGSVDEPRRRATRFFDAFDLASRLRLRRLACDFLRRAEIWFADKRAAAVSPLYSLAEFKRDAEPRNLAVEYQLGKFGALPERRRRKRRAPPTLNRRDANLKKTPTGSRSTLQV